MLHHLGQGDGALLPGQHVLQRGLAPGKLVTAQDHRVAVPVLVGLPHLPLQASPLEVQRGPQAASPERLNEVQRRGERLGPGRGHVHAGVGRGLRRRLLCLQGGENPLLPDGKADGRRGWAAQLFHQAVIAAAARHGILGTQGRVQELEGRPGVIVEAPHQPLVHRVLDLQPVQHAPHGREMVAAGFAQVGRDRGRPGRDLLAGRHLAVQDPQRILREPHMAVRAQRAPAGLRIGHERLAVRRAARRVADAVQVQLNPAQAPGLQQVVKQSHHLGIHGRARRADRLHVNLVELAEAAGLGPLVAEHGPDEVELHQAALGTQAVLDVGPHEGGGGLRPERQAFAPPILEGVHLLFDDVGALPDPADEEFGALEGRGADLGIAVAVQHVAGDDLQRLPLPRLFGEDIRCTPDALDHVDIPSFRISDLRFRI